MNRSSKVDHFTATIFIESFLQLSSALRSGLYVEQHCYCIVRNIVKRYGKTTAVDNLSFDVREGSIYCLAGPNGAGKTTTLKIIVGLLKPDSRYVTVDGYDVVANRVEALKRISFVPDVPDFPQHLTALEVLYFVATLAGLVSGFSVMVMIALVCAQIINELLHNDLKSLWIIQVYSPSATPFVKGFRSDMG